MMKWLTRGAATLGIAVVGLLVWANLPQASLSSGLQADRILIQKSARRLVLYHEGIPIKTYAIALGRHPAGPKLEEGDCRTPEGQYVIDGRKNDSAFHLALHVSYPSATDSARAEAAGLKPGGDIMIHGLRNGLGWVGRLHSRFDWTAGCIAVTNPEIEEIWRAVPNDTPVEIVP